MRIQGTSSERQNFDGLAFLVSENSIPPLKIEVLWKIGKSKPGSYPIPYLVPTQFLTSMARPKFLAQHRVCKTAYLEHEFSEGICSKNSYELLVLKIKRS